MSRRQSFACRLINSELSIDLKSRCRHCYDSGKVSISYILLFSYLKLLFCEFSFPHGDKITENDPAWGKVPTNHDAWETTFQQRGAVGMPALKYYHME